MLHDNRTRAARLCVRAADAAGTEVTDTDGPATGETSLTRWITDHKDTLGRSYANELTHFR